MFALKFVLGQLNLNLECGHICVYKVPVVGYKGGGMWKFKTQPNYAKLMEVIPELLELPILNNFELRT